jgi:PHP family Zn ribbon phosphoesterase
MKNFRADLHIHTTLSPCGDLDMHPARIVYEAAGKGIDIIGITDHNTTRQCALVSKLAAEKGIYVLHGAEVTTKEEVHCLTFFEKTDALHEFQEFLDASLPDINNVPEIFGDQVETDENGMIVYEEKKLLLSAISKSFEEVGSKVRQLGGIFIPAHIDRKKNSIYSQLGFLPESLEADALEISTGSTPHLFANEHPEIKKFSLISSSDAHLPESIGTAFTVFHIEEKSFAEILMALRGEKGRMVVTQ